MTSRTLSNKMFIQELRRHLWAYIISAFVLVIFVPLALLMEIDGQLMSGYLTRRDIADNIKSFLSQGMGGGIVITLILGIVFAFISFGYLYSKSRVDLYHSMPINRRSLFFAEFLSSALPEIVAIILVGLLTIGAIAAKGFLTGEMLALAAVAMLRMVVLFLLAMVISTISIMITGNKVVGVLGSIFLFTCVGIVEDMISSYCYFCFQTYSGTQGSDPLWKQLLTPITLLGLNSDVTNGKGLLIIALFIVEAVVLLIVAIKLYEKRPSECVNRPLCYDVLKPVLRIPTVIVAALMGGIYVSYISSSLPSGWYWAMFIVFAVVTHIIMDAIFEQGFRNALKHKLQLVISIVIAAVIAIIFQYDFIGYDRYLPDAGSLESASISLESIEGEIPSYDLDSSGGRLPEYLDRTTERLENVRFEDPSIILSMAGHGIDALSSEKSAIKRAQDEHRRNNYDEVEKNSYIICYHLKSGKDVYRSYRAPMDVTYADTAAIFEDENYKNHLYMIRKYIDKNLVGDITLSNGYGDETVTLRGDENNAFLAEFAKDLDNRTLDILANNTPIVALSDYDTQSYASYTSGYYLYESDTNALAYLKSIGKMIVPSDIRFDSNKAEEIIINDYRSEDNRGGSVVITYTPDSDYDKIKKICEISVLDSFTYCNSVLHPYVNGIDINVSYIDNTGMNVMRGFRIPYGMMPAEVEADLEMEKANNPQIEDMPMLLR